MHHTRKYQSSWFQLFLSCSKTPDEWLALGEFSKWFISPSDHVVGKTSKHCSYKRANHICPYSLIYMKYKCWSKCPCWVHWCSWYWPAYITHSIQITPSMCKLHTIRIDVWIRSGANDCCSISYHNTKFPRYLYNRIFGVPTRGHLLYVIQKLSAIQYVTTSVCSWPSPLCMCCIYYPPGHKNVHTYGTSNGKSCHISNLEKKMH